MNPVQQHARGASHARRVSNFPTTLLTLLFGTAAGAHAAELTGTVLSRDKTARPNVAVDVLGATKIFTQTNAAGQFSVTLAPGMYIIQVRDGTRTAQFRLQIGSADVRADYPLKW